MERSSFLPKSITVRVLPDRVIITERGDPWMKRLAIPVFAAMTLFPFVVALRDSHPVHPNIPPLIILGLIGAAFWYWILAESLNRITVTVSAGAITRWAGPIPLPPARYAAGTVRVVDLERIYCSKGTRVLSGSGNFYNLMARTKDRQRVTITGGHNDPETVLTLGRLVGDRIGSVEVSLDIPTDVHRPSAGPYLDNRQRRAFRVLVCSIGGCIILLSLVLASIKTVHIYTSARSPGVITSFQEHPHRFGRYSFWVTFTANGRTVHAYSFTGSLLVRREGDKVTVFYDPRDPSQPEILIPDDDWLIFAMIFAFGSGIVGLAARLLRPVNTTTSRTLPR